ncbi:MAG TPA: serine hydrolase [Solirubrobacteraceae bacterium]|nr:serine hydrolase [Solirubrobacteraceae bacterium]
MLALLLTTLSISPISPVTSAAVGVHDLGPGHTRIAVRLEHAVQARRVAPSQVSWFVRPRGKYAFALAAVTSTRELSPGLTYASAIFDPPARRFVYRICLSPSWARGTRLSKGRHGCPRGTTLEYEGKGRGRPAEPYPSADAIAAASSFLASRAGRTSFAVVDSTGRLSGLNVREHFETASVVKVMFLVAYLQMLSAHRRDLSSADNALLYPMIHISDNEAASSVFAIVGNGAIARVARESGMTDYAPGVSWWAYTQSTAADQARLFFALERLIPRRFYAYARGLLDGIEPSQSWGFPPIARPQWQVFFKTGALPSQGLFNEAARLERPGTTFSVAVFTDGDPSMAYGEETIEGVAARLLAHSP